MMAVVIIDRFSHEYEYVKDSNHVLLSRANAYALACGSDWRIRSDMGLSRRT